MSRAKSDFRFHSARVDELRKQRDIAGLVQALGDPTCMGGFTVRRSAASALGRVRVKDAVPVLVRLLSDPDERVRESAASGLAKTGGADALRALASVLDDESTVVRGNASSCLGIYGGASVVPLLIPLLESKSWLFERGGVIASLLAIGDPTGVELAERQLRRERLHRRLTMRRWVQRMKKLRQAAQATATADGSYEISAEALGSLGIRFEWALELSNAATVLPDEHERDRDIIACELRSRCGSGRLVPMLSSLRVLAETRDGIRELRELVAARIRDHDLSLVMTVWRWNESWREWEEDHSFDAQITDEEIEEELAALAPYGTDVDEENDY